MQYKVRLNPRSFNPLTRRVDLSRLWEVEQVADKDSAKVIWHCTAVRVGEHLLDPVLFAQYQKTTYDEIVYHGIITRNGDNEIAIREGRHDVG